MSMLPTMIGTPCEVCKKAGRTPPGKMYPNGARSIDEKVGGPFHNEYYELECDNCGAVMHADVAGLTSEGRRQIEEYVKKLKDKKS